MSATPHPAAAATLAQWRRMVADGDLGELPPLVHAGATFHSPMAFKPYHSAAAVVFILRTVSTILRNFAYHRELFSDDGLSAVLEFSAEVNGKQLKGIDLIRFDASGKIVDFEVMIRPLNGLQALGEEMAKRVADVLPGYKEAGPGVPSPRG